MPTDGRIAAAIPEPGSGGRRRAGRLRALLDRWQPPQELVLVVTALVVGLVAGLGAVAFRYLIHGVEWVGFHLVPALTGWSHAHVLVVPVVGGVIVGLLIFFFAPEAKGHGVPEVMEAVALRGGRIRPVVALIKALASSVCIGSGGSVGREGPIVQIGSALGSTVARALKLSEDRTANLVACGAAAGIAGTFNAPIAGVLFALEVIQGGRLAVRYLSTVVVSAVAASVIGRVAFGNVPAFSIPAEYGIQSPWEFLLYPLLGAAAAVVGTVFVRLLYGMEDLFERWQGPPVWLKPAVGGLLLGGMALAYPLLTGVHWEGTPQVFGVGYPVIEDALADRLGLTALLCLLVLKLLATGLTLGSGGSGGVFAPSLFLGAMLGGSFALVVSHLLPGLTAPAGAYALVGMAAVFAAAAHAPMTAVIILFELTGDYRIILPLMLTVVIATVLAQRLLDDESIYTLKLTRRGVRLRRGRDVDLMEGVEVGEVMNHDPDTVLPDRSLGELAELFDRRRTRGVLVVDDADGRLAGIVTVSDLEEALDAGRPRDTPVAEIATPSAELQLAFPDETMGEALARMGTRGIGRLPVVSRDDPGRLLGVVRRQDILRAYDLASTRRAEIRSRTREGLTDGALQFVDIRLGKRDVAVGESVRDTAGQLPSECILVSIRRDGKVVIPHGDTRFAPGDEVTAFVRRGDVEELRRRLTRGVEPVRR